MFGQSLRFNNALVSSVLHEIENSYGKRFLYRDAIVAGKRVSLSVDENNFMQSLKDEMRRIDLDLKESDHIIVVSELEVGEQKQNIRGFVFDAQSGSRLPGATVIIRDSKSSSRDHGVISNVDGRFSLSVLELASKTLEIRYIGYESFLLNGSEISNSHELPIRLKPIINAVSEVTVYGNHFQSHLDSTWHFLTQAALPSGYDDQSLLRDFQILPAVNITSAVSGDVNVRGSQSSGFRIELDGAPIYGQQHLFGLYDVFNPDAISRSALYYGASPSKFEDAGGGVLSLRTRPASMISPRMMASFSNSTGSLTLETPIVKERASLMVSGRSSTPLASSWYGSDEVVSRGLGIPIVFDIGDRDLEHNLFDATTAGSFYDLHARLIVENKNGSKIDAIAYYANENASGESTRVIPSLLPNRPPANFRVENNQVWDNTLGRLAYSWVAAEKVHMSMAISSSSYEGSILKDDLVERRNGDLKFSKYENKNTMSEIKWSHQSYVSLNRNSSLELGLKIKKLKSSYLDVLQDETRVDATIAPTILDGSVGYGIETGKLEANFGLRSQHDLDRGIFVISPKTNLSVEFADRYSISFSASRNNEFVQRLDLGADLRSNIWLAGGPNARPTETNEVAISNQFRIGNHLAFRLDGYLKKINNLWEFRAGRRTGSPNELGFLNYDSESFSRGLELMSSLRLAKDLQATFNYTLSKSEIWNDRSENGRRYDAEWDRTHQLSSRIKGKISERFSFSLTGLFASGAPNELRFDSPDEIERLDKYLRIDLGLDTKWTVGGKPLFLSFYCFNLTDRKNPWYRTPVSFVTREPNSNDDRDPRFVNVDVYDLGIMPSFKLRLGL